MPTILGVSAFYHDSAACLVVDGDIVAAAQEERFTRKKHDPNFPTKAIEYCLREAGKRPSDIDYVVFYEKPFRKFERLIETYLAFAPSGLKSFGMAIPVWLKEKIRLPKIIREELGREVKAPIVFADHHESHAASAFFPSPYDEAAILTLDGVGEWSTTTYGIGRGNKIELTKQIQFPHSLGLLYSAVTYHCGFKVNSGEYKLMGLAPYGRPVFKDLMTKHLIDLKPDGSFWLDMQYFNYCQGLTMTNSRFDRLFGAKPRDAESNITQREMDMAASIQAITEDAMLAIGRQVFKETGQKHLVLAGGVALNCVANGRLLREGPFEDIWIQPAAGDAGGALGAALFAWHQLLDNPRTPHATPQASERSEPRSATSSAGVGPRATTSQASERSEPRSVTSSVGVGPHATERKMTSDSQKGSYLGPRFSSATIATFLDTAGAKYRRATSEADLLTRVVDLLEQEKIVGWFQGRMEFGPRALGARSIIGDPRSAKMQANMNLKIKFRESFRPFAPIVLREEAHKWFGIDPDHESPYMLLVAPVLDEHRLPVTDAQREIMKNDPDLRNRVNIPRSSIPAVTHVDYSARLQTVDDTRNPRLAGLLREFQKRTGCPILVNTSFNVRGEPIVCTPEDAYRCFLGTEMDVLVLEDCVLLKDDVAEKLDEATREKYLAQFQLD